MLISTSGLPGAGKTTIPRRLAAAVGAVHLRIDTIEQAMLRAGLGRPDLGPSGYAVACALAEDHLRQGLTVIADSVNPLAVTREAWHAVAARAGVRAVDVEVSCSLPSEHQRRVASRTADIPDHRLPTWEDVVTRDYEPWTTSRIRLDTAGRTVDQCVAELHRALAEYTRGPA